MDGRRRVAIVFTGGTISMLPDPTTGAARPSLDGAAILARIGGLDAIADVEPIDWGLVPASHLSFDQISDIARTVQVALSRDDIDGAVVVQGTDVMEETAFAFDLLVGTDKPVIVVGAMRNAGDPAWDGPRNLLDAVRIAATPAAQGIGTVVAMAGTILPGDDAIKVHTSREDAFAAPNSGPLGSASEVGVRFDRARGARRRLVAIPERAAEPVFLVTATVAMDGAVLRAMAGLSPAGLVVAATGSGNTDPDLLEAARGLMADGVPVALASRTLSGGVSGAYGFPGGGATWLAAGAMPCGTLSGPKAKVALAYGLGAGLADTDLRALMAGPEASP